MARKSISVFYKLLEIRHFCEGSAAPGAVEQTDRKIMNSCGIPAKWNVAQKTSLIPSDYVMSSKLLFLCRARRVSDTQHPG
jgi:hypothetical protein